MKITENEIAADPAFVQSIKDAANEQGRPMTPESFLQHLQDIVNGKAK